jgi:predicted adenine nucleotide alpha hydrolase (AANH) superfamily ATPase
LRACRIYNEGIKSQGWGVRRQHGGMFKNKERLPVCMEKVLLHVCCAPCSTHAIERLLKEYMVVLFFSDSNIWPKEEYEKRLGEARKIAKAYNLELVEDGYDNDRWMEWISGLEAEPERGARCHKCFEFNLRRAAEYAKAKMFNYFTTTLTIAPHKDSKAVFEVGRMLADKWGVRFLEIDFKKLDGFRHSLELSEKHQLYRQDYCGCRYSVRK